MHTYLFSLQLSGLLQAGLSMYESLLAFKRQSYLPFLQEISEQMIEELRKGESMAHQVSLSPFFEKHFATVIEHGEASGMLAREMYTYSQFLLENAELKIEKWMSWPALGYLWSDGNSYTRCVFIYSFTNVSTDGASVRRRAKT